MDRSSDAWQDPAQLHSSIQIMQDNIKGLKLVRALNKTPGQVELTSWSGLKSFKSPADCLRLVDGSDCYVGTGSNRRVRTIAYQEPPKRPVELRDSGFSLARYPLPCESTLRHRVTKFAA